MADIDIKIAFFIGIVVINLNNLSLLKLDFVLDLTVTSQ
jgi:hypothetical protein